MNRRREHQNWHREYQPTLGRYIESDPIGLRGGPDTYIYGHDNPVSAVDPLGLYSVDPPLRRPR